MARIGDRRGKKGWRSSPRADDDLADVLRSLGTKVSSLRKALNLTQEAFAQNATVDVRHVQDIEYGRSNLTIATLRAIAKALNVTVSELLDGVC